MKDERNVRHSRAAGRKWQPVAILLAAVLMVLSVPFGSRAVRAVDLDQNCSLKVNPGNSLVADDISTAKVVIDLYRVADAIPVKGFDTYDWQMTDPFSSITIDKKIDNEGWKKLAQQAADVQPRAFIPGFESRRCQEVVDLQRQVETLFGRVDLVDVRHPEKNVFSHRQFPRDPPDPPLLGLLPLSPLPLPPGKPPLKSGMFPPF